MERRRFILQGLGCALGLAIPRWARASVATADSAGRRAPGIGSAAAPELAAAPDSTATREPQVLLAAGGDTTLGYNLEAHFDEQVAAGVPKEQLWPLYFAGVRPLLEEADIALVNLECPFT